MLTAHSSADRGSKILSYLADVTVNQPHGPRTSTVYPHDKLPAIDLSVPPPPGSKQRLTQLGPEGFARWMRESGSLGVTDTTFRDAHQSLLATRIRTTGLLKVAPYIARTMPQLLSVECWGGATYDVALRFLKEDPWQRLAALRETIPNICLQMLLRGRNTVGYTPYPEIVTTAFVEEAARTGIDIFRIFDALNNVDSMRPAIDAVRDTGKAVAEVAMSYTGDLSDPTEKLYTLDYYLKLAERIVVAGAHVLAIKDMAGLLRAPAAATLVSALKSRFDLPVHVHTHDTPGGQLATYLAAWHAGANAVDGAAAPWPGPQASLRCPRSWPPRRKLPSTPGCRCPQCAIWSRTGRHCERFTRPSNPDYQRRPGGCTAMRFQVDSCRTCGSRPLRSGSVIGSKTSKTLTQAPMPSSGAWSR
ncbi:HMGL-like family protein [Mycobacterium xenopi 4042]|uniref:HMGL-like family protein n=1 Tax=Mycobacterium xenopi 4042 TaxID=1299334 RepID=X7ZU25_MYCXE|nr:HMGL-like family protein [Mycobacterium xenopi 4042]